ncbi:Thioredoxin F1, chloroplastic [Linum perenne]
MNTNTLDDAIAHSNSLFGHYHTHPSLPPSLPLGLSPAVRIDCNTAFVSISAFSSSVGRSAMSLIHLSTSSCTSPNSFPTCSPLLSSLNKDHSLSFSASPNSSLGCTFSKRRLKYSILTVKSSMETVATVGQVTEVSNDTFWPIVKSAGDKTVVLDMYTQWLEENVVGFPSLTGQLRVHRLPKDSVTSVLSDYYDLVVDIKDLKLKLQGRTINMVMAPKYEELSKKYLDVVFLKLDCNTENRPLAKELGIKVVPTFKILKDNKVVKEVTGAKFDDLVIAIDNVRSS